ncbi:MAG TPA: hypothetical protein VF017_15550 [Thermoanaerobaculia bacterium]|nr:hypothetical protein [Thermoanaerobaculia bacterium]
MSLPPGPYADPVLDGYAFPSRALGEMDVRGEATRTLRTAASGARHLQLTYHGAGFPVLRRRRRFELRSDQVGDFAGLLERILADPGVHTLATWRPETLLWAGDGDRTEFLTFWPSAPDLVAVPGGLAAAPLYPEVRLGSPSAAPLTTVRQSQEDYDAGDPAAGEAWFLLGGSRFKLEAAPAAGSRIYAAVVPLYSVVEEGADDRTYRAPRREPRTVALVEA